MDYTELSKLLYHGSFVAVSEIDLSRSVPKKDFGQGFYTTNDKEQAEKFARLKAKREHTEKGYVSVFRFQNTGDFSVRKFGAVDEEWFDFVLRNRGFAEFASPAQREAFDIVIGPVADDAVGLVLNQFIVGTYGVPSSAEARETAIRLLLTQKLHNQLFFGAEQAVSHLIFQEAYDVRSD